MEYDDSYWASHGWFPTHFACSKKESKQSSVSVQECLKYKTTVSIGNVTPNADEIPSKMS